MTWLTVRELRDLEPDVPLGILVEGVAVCLVYTCGEIYAVHDECTHAAEPLSEGDIADRTIECWMHGSRFDLRTGAALNLPATKPVRTYPARLLNGRVQILPP